MSAPTLLPTGLPGPLPAAATPEQLEALAGDLRAAGLEPLRSSGELEGLSSDAFVYSPVLQPLLQGRRAQIGVRPNHRDQVPAIAAACARHGVSLTLRGAGTGNYGQCVPLAGGLVLDTSGIGQVFGMGPEVPLVTSYGAHAIVKTMKDIPSGFPISRSLAVKNGAKTTVEKLFETSDNSFATQNLKSAEIKQSASDKKGPLILGAAGTYNGEGTKGQFVVVGSSSWIANSFLRFNGNRDLVLNMFNWLSNDEELISIRPKDPEDRRLNMNVKQSTLLFYASVVVIPLLVVVAGVGVWWRRR